MRISADSNVLVPVGLCLGPLLLDAIVALEQKHNLFGTVADVDSLVLALVVNMLVGHECCERPENKAQQRRTKKRKKKRKSNPSDRTCDPERSG